MGTLLRFSVRCSLPSPPASGRLLIALVPASSAREPRRVLGDAEAGDTTPSCGVEARFDTASTIITVDTAKAIDFPAGAFARLKAGRYRAQAVFAGNPNDRSVEAEGNLYSAPVEFEYHPDATSPRSVELVLSQIFTDRTPVATDTLRWVSVRSERLSRFWKRPITLRAGVVLPPDFAANPTQRFPLCIYIGGFATSYRSARFRPPAPGIVQVQLDGAGPLGDPYQVNSANHGPYGDAVTQELIPAIEKQFRCGGDEWARFTTGVSTGGWVSLALQIFYPQYFGGCWSSAPDPLDFRAYQKIDIYHDKNAYIDAAKREIPSSQRRDSGQVLFTVRQECRMENVLGHGGRYVTSAGQWGAWNATFGPRGKDGQPVPLWDPSSGTIDPKTLAHWEGYDLRRYIERHWRKIAPHLRGKIRVRVGDLDEYFLDGGVRLFAEAVKKLQPPAEARIEFYPQGTHDNFFKREEMFEQMLQVYRKHHRS